MERGRPVGPGREGRERPREGNNMSWAFTFPPPSGSIHGHMVPGVEDPDLRSQEPAVERTLMARRYEFLNLGCQESRIVSLTFGSALLAPPGRNSPPGSSNLFLAHTASTFSLRSLCKESKCWVGEERIDDDGNCRPHGRSHVSLTSDRLSNTLPEPPVRVLDRRRSVGEDMRQKFPSTAVGTGKEDSRFVDADRRLLRFLRVKSSDGQ